MCGPETSVRDAVRLNAAGALASAAEADSTPPAALDTFHLVAQ